MAWILITQKYLITKVLQITKIQTPRKNTGLDSEIL